MWLELQPFWSNKDHLWNPFKCEIGDYSCAQSPTFKRHHESALEKTKLFKYEICDYSCEQSTTLKRHIAVHEGTLTKYIIIHW